MGEQTLLDPLCSMPDYRARREHVFRSDGSLQWYVRTHRPALIDYGAVLRQCGRWLVHAQRFDEFVLAQASREAERYAGDRPAAAIAGDLS